MFRRRRSSDDVTALAEAGWVLPHAIERARRAGVPAKAEWALVGNVGSPGKAAVDPRGLVVPAGATWSLDWWVGADDRWHVPSREAAVRQRRLGAAPVVETAMRVPSGDAVQRVYGARLGATDAVVVEIENASPIPFAVALAVRPLSVTGRGSVGAVGLQGRLVTVDEEPALVLPRTPNLAATATGEQDVANIVMAGGATGPTDLAWPVRDTGRSPSATAAFLFPVPHRTRLRVALVSGADHEVDVNGLPSADAVVASWDAVLRHGARVVLPDERVQAAVDAARASLTLFDDGRVVRPAPIAGGATPADAVAIVTALERWGLDRHAGEAGQSLPPRWRRRHTPPARLDAADRVRRALADAGPMVTWAAGAEGHHGRPTAEFLLAVRDLLVSDATGSVAMLPEFPPEWEGHPIEAHDLPVAGGRLSYAVRWHGDRPALLWECTGDVTTISAPGLDPEWSSTEERGEALLRTGAARPAGLRPPGA